MEHLEDFGSLVEKARGGDRESFERIAAIASGPLRISVQAGLGDKLKGRLDIEDILQETFLQAFKAMGRFRGRDEPGFGRWLGKIAHRVILREASRLDAKKRDPRREVRWIGDREDSNGGGGLPDLLDARSLTPGTLLSRKEKFERLQKALDSLRPEYRQVILLARVKGLPMKEVAARMERSLEAASMLLLRAQRKLKAAFGRLTTTDSVDLPHDRSLGGEEERHE